MIELIYSILIPFLALIIPYYKLHNVGFNISDEGYLWYGVQQTLKGKVPIRDFRAYDPGRYYWCVFWCKIFGDNLLSIRLGMKVFQFIIYFIIFVTLNPVLNSVPIIFLLLITLSLWSSIIHKTIDNAVPVLSIASLTYFLMFPSQFSMACFGLVLGFTLIIGLNHFIYNGLAMIGTLVISYSILNSDIILFGLIGLCLGVLPFIMFLMIPRSASTYWEKKIARILIRKTTNLKLPIPLPWNNHPEKMNNNVYKIALQWTLLIIPIFYLISIILLWSTELNSPLLLASILVGIPYTNHIYSRADKNHIITGISPLIFGLFGIYQFNILIFWPLFLLLLLSFYHLVWKADYRFYYDRNYAKAHTKLFLGKLEILLPQTLSDQIIRITTFIKNNDLDKSKFFAPMLAGYYAILNTSTPTYDTFPVYPPSQKEQEKMLADIKNSDIDFCMIRNFALDGEENLKFEKTYPQVWNYLNNEFKQINLFNNDHQIFIKPECEI